MDSACIGLTSSNRVTFAESLPGPVVASPIWSTIESNRDSGVPARLRGEA